MADGVFGDDEVHAWSFRCERETDDFRNGGRGGNEAVMVVMAFGVTTMLVMTVMMISFIGATLVMAAGIVVSATRRLLCVVFFVMTAFAGVDFGRKETKIQLRFGKR